MKSFFKSWLGHLAAYVSSGAGIVAAIDPTFLPPVGKLAVASASLLVAATHHAYTAGTLAGAVTAASNALAKVPTAAVVAMLALVATVSTAGLTGCTTAQDAQVQAVLSSPQAQVLVTAAVDAAVATAETKGVTAAQINSVAKVAMAAAGSTGATLSTVAAAANAAIAKAGIPPGDAAAISLLETLIGAEIQSRITASAQAGADVATLQVAVADVLTAVIAATGG